MHERQTLEGPQGTSEQIWDPKKTLREVQPTCPRTQCTGNGTVGAENNDTSEGYVEDKPKNSFFERIAKFSRWIVLKGSPLTMRWEPTTKVITLFRNESF
jgi:hypothetical protein